MRLAKSSTIIVACVALPWGGSAIGCSAGDAGDAIDDAVEPGTDGSSVDPAAFDASHDDRQSQDSDMPCSPDGFCRTVLPGVPQPIVNGIFAASPTRTVATTRDGKILLWDGSVWKTIALGYTHLTSVWASDPDHFWIVEPYTRLVHRLTFEGDRAVVVPEALPYDFTASGCVRYTGNNGKGSDNFAISGTSETDIYVAAYCFSGNDRSTALLFHRGKTEGEDDAAASWSLLWSDGRTPTFPQFFLGAVHAVAPGEAYAVGWKVGPNLSNLFSDKTFHPSRVLDDGSVIPGTITAVLHIKDGVVEEEDLDPSLAMCADSVWSSGSPDSLFIGGACERFEGIDYYDTSVKYTSIARRANLDGQGPRWIPMVQMPNSTIRNHLDWPATVWGFSDTDVYVAGSYVKHWDGVASEFVEIALNGAPFATKVNAMHGTSSNNMWIVGGASALHRDREASR